MEEVERKGDSGFKRTLPLFGYDDALGRQASAIFSMQQRESNDQVCEQKKLSQKGSVLDNPSRSVYALGLTYLQNKQHRK
eukprot:8303211-Ditylum_brightwellii.AAC.1